MTDYLLHPDLVVELLHAPGDPRVAKLVARAEAGADGLWLPVAAMSYMRDSLAAVLGGEDAARQAAGRLRDFADHCTWLGAPAGDGDFVDADDPLRRQLEAGLDRLGPGACLVRLAGDAQRSVGIDELVSTTPREAPVPFIDLPYQQRRIRKQVEEGLFRVLAHGRYIGGPEIESLEERLSRFAGVRHAIAVSNGTDALLIALMAAGVRAGDEVVTSPFTFAATGEMIHLLGARPVYVDIDPVTYNLDPDGIEAVLTDRTRAILPVSIFGQCADMQAINAVAAARGIPVIEDGAQSFGATQRERRSCGLSSIGCTSFFPSKPLGGYGDSGACFSDDDELAAIMRQVRDHGQGGRYHHVRIGINGRMSSFQASVLLAKLELLDEEIELRGRVAARYDRLFAERAGALDPDRLVVPRVADGNTSVYAQYSLLVRGRDAVQARLTELGIPSAVHYPVPLNRQPAMADPDCHVPVCEDVSARVLSIPMHPYLGEVAQRRIVDGVIEAVKAA